MRNQKILLIITTIFCLLGMGCSSQDVMESNVEKNTYTLNLNGFSSSKEEVKIKKVDYLTEPPTLFTYISNSDYVVEVVAKKYEYVGKVKKQEKLDVSDYLAMYVFPFNVENVYCSKDSLSKVSNLEKNKLQNFQLIVPAEQLSKNQYKEGQRFLLFIKKVAQDENLSNTYELNNNETYYRVFEGEKSILPNDGGFHSPPKKGRINISDARYQDTVNRVKTFCSAVNVTDKSTKIKNLQNLTKSNDFELGNNAKYAIEYLKDKSKLENDEFQEFIDILESNDETLTFETKTNAIKKLGDAKVKRAIPVLIKYIDYEDEAEVLRRTPKPNTIITQYNDIYPTQRYPATGALLQMGKSALPFLVKVIEKNKTDSIKCQNALFVIQQIYSEDWLKAVLYLEKASTESKSPNGSERLQVAAQKIRVQWDKLQNLKGKH